MNAEAEKIKYVCHKRTSLLNTNSNNNNNNNNTQFLYVSSYIFYSNGCTKTAQTINTSVFISCANKKGVFKCRLFCEFELRDGSLDANMPNGRLMFLLYLMLEKVKHQKQMTQVISTKKSDERKRMEKALELSKTRLKFHVREKEELGKSIWG